MSNKPDFLSRLSNKPLLCDGATGTALYGKGATAGQCLDELNLTQPAMVADVHRAYIDAGADVIETNTFGANRVKLIKYGLENKLAEINAAAVQLARRAVQASFKEVYIAGAMGPLGAHLAPLGHLQPEQAFAAFKEQATALIENDVDLIILETFGNLLELEQAIAAVRAVSQTVPLVAQVTFTNDGFTPMGDTPAKVAQMLGSANVDVVGVNCSVGPARVLRSVRAMAKHLPPHVKLAAQPNAGWPQQVEGRLMYPATPDYLADYATAFTQAGVSLIGGCCGTTPQHIAQMRNALDNPPAQSPIFVESGNGTDAPDSTADTLEPTRLAKALAAGEFVTSVEMHPPRGASAARVLAAAQTLRDAGATVVNVADSPVARMKMSPWAACHLIQTEAGLETILNFPTRGRNLLRIQGDLLAAHALNIRNLFVVMGDPTSIGDYPEAFNNHDVVSTGLIQLVKQKFNQGVDYSGREISQPTHFLVGGALNLNATNPAKEIGLLKKKIDNGADFVMTQPIYTLEPLHNFVRLYEQAHGPLTLPIIASVLPLYSARHARFLHNEVPGIIIPQAMQDRLDRAGEENAGREGLAMARDLLFELKDNAAGAYIMPPFKRYDFAAELLESIRG